MSATSGINPATASYHAMQHARILDTSLSRLSSGIRVQSGADDASGLTVSERLRNQIRGLNRAMSNVQNAMSMSQTAGGALQETQSLLLRMRELSIQAQNDAMNQSDRLEIQKEVDQLINEIDKIALGTEFNQKKLLDGTASSRLSASPKDMKMYQVDEKFEPLGNGNYDVKILHNSYGKAEIQKSAVQLSKFNFEPAGATDRLKDSSLFDDFLAFGEVNIEIQSSSGKVVVAASSSMTNSEFAQAMEQAITRPPALGGLGMTEASFRYKPETGQFEYKAGLSGNQGQLHFLMPENWKNSLGMEVSEPAVQPSFHVIASQNGQVVGADLSSGNSALPIPGIKLEFPPPMPAEAKLTIAHTKLGDEPIIISITSTNSHAAYAPRQAGQFTSAPNAGKAVIVIEPNPNLSFADIVQQLETQIQATAPNLGMNISIVGNQVYFVASESGESSLLDIKTNKAGAALFSSDIEPPTEFYVTGSGGTEGAMVGTTPIAPVYDVPVPFQFRFYDQDGGSLINSPLIPAGPITYNDLLSTTNDALRAAGLKLSVYDRLGNGTFQVYSTEIGTDTRFQMDIHVPEKMIEIPSLLSFTAVDRNRQNTGANQTLEANISVAAGTYGLNELEDLINSQIQALPAAQRPRIIAKFRDDYDGQNSSGTQTRNNSLYREGAGDFMLALQDNAVGTSSRISIYNVNATASSVLGIASGGVSGAGSTLRTVTATSRLSGLDQLTPDAFNFRIVDGSGNEVHIPFPAGASLSSDSAFGGTDIVSYINANRGSARVQASYVTTNALNGTVNPVNTGVLSNQPLPMDLNLSFRETFPGFNEVINVVIPAGTDLSTFDFTSIDLSPTQLTLSNNGGNLEITPDPRGPNLAAYNFSMTIDNPAPEGLNEGSAALGMNTGARLRLQSLDSGSNTQFLWQITGPAPADATAIGNGLGLNGSYNTFQGEAGYGANSPAAPGFTAPRRPAGNGDIYHDDGESPNWTDPQYTQHARMTPAGYTVNRAVESAPAGAAGLTFGATTIMRDLGLEALMDSKTALAHNSDTVSIKSLSGTGGVSAYAKLTPVPITVLKKTENTEFDVQLPTGASLRISLIKALPPDGVIVGLTMDELEETLKTKLTPANLTYELDRDIPEITIRSRELGNRASFSVSPNPETGFIKYSGSGYDSYSINMQESRQVFQVGANQSQQIKIGIGNMESASLGVKNLQIGTVKQATDALQKLDAASTLVMATQAKLGAFENRMQHISQSLQQTALNITSANSRIRDTDIAHESVLQSKTSMQQDLSTQIIKRIPQMTKRLWEQLLAGKQAGSTN
ncbi:MAG: hypothetical protein H3C47_10625 [Candidatus Cloacimonetes bacterium]|nr:hypothetical protein [Candidatus Cloacimonadota bacterium]